MGENERAQSYYNKAIKILCKLRKPEDIAEVHYNMSLNCVMLGQYDKAQEYLTQCMKAIEKLHLNSLRVCMDCLLWFPFYRETVLTVRGICIAAASF